MRTINDEIGLKTNLQWQCGNCETLNDVAEKVCHKCGLAKNKFLEAMSKRTDEQLQEILDSPPGDYQPEAIEAAKQEIKKRKLTQQENKYPMETKQKISYSESDYEPSRRNTPESALKTIATIVLVCGIIISVAFFIAGIVLVSDYYGKTIGRALLFSIIPVLLSSIVIWALLRVFSNISINVREIKEKLK